MLSRWSKEDKCALLRAASIMDFLICMIVNDKAKLHACFVKKGLKVFRIHIFFNLRSWSWLMKTMTVSRQCILGQSELKDGWAEASGLGYWNRMEILAHWGRRQCGFGTGLEYLGQSSGWNEPLECYKFWGFVESMSSINSVILFPYGFSCTRGWPTSTCSDSCKVWFRRRGSFDTGCTHSARGSVWVQNASKWFNMQNEILSYSQWPGAVVFHHMPALASFFWSLGPWKVIHLALEVVPSGKDLIFEVELKQLRWKKSACWICIPALFTLLLQHAEANPDISAIFDSSKMFVHTSCLEGANSCNVSWCFMWVCSMKSWSSSNRKCREEAAASTVASVASGALGGRCSLKMTTYSTTDH